MVVLLVLGCDVLYLLVSLKKAQCFQTAKRREYYRVPEKRVFFTTPPNQKSTPTHPINQPQNTQPKTTQTKEKKRLKISFLCRIPIAAGQSCAHIENHRAINLPPPRAHHHKHRPHSNRPMPPAISAAPYVTALEESSRFRRIQVQSQILFSSY